MWMRKCEWCGKEYDVHKVVTTASWKTRFCCMACAKKAGAVK